jgi:hypothetical protein
MSVADCVALVEDLCRGVDSSGRLSGFDPARLPGHGGFPPGILAATYTAPEVLRGGRATVRSDVFVLGLVLYEWTAGQPAFISDDAEILRQAILYADPTPLAVVAPGTPRAVANIVERALAKDPRRRFASLDDLRRELARVHRQLTGAPAADDAATVFGGVQRGDVSGREWFAAAGLFVESVAPHRWLGAGMSLAGHSVVAAAVVAAVIVHPYIAPAVPHAETIFLSAAPPPPPPAPPPQPNAPAPPKPAKPVPPTSTAVPMPAPVVGPPPAPVVEPTAMPTANPLTTGVTTVIDVPPPPPTATGSDVGLPPQLPSKVDDDPVTVADTYPEFVKKVQPKVPVGANGKVRVQVVIQRDGRVGRVVVLDSTPWDDQIKLAASQCIFRPATKRLRPVAFMTVITFDLETKR